MDTLYRFVGICVVWAAIGTVVGTFLAVLWTTLGAFIFTLRVCNYLGWKTSKGVEITYKQAFDFWKHVLSGYYEPLYSAAHKKGYVIYPWPWLLAKDRKKHIEKYETWVRGC